MGWTWSNKPAGMKAAEKLMQGMGEEFSKRIIKSSTARGCVFFVARFHEPNSDIYIPDAEGFVNVILIYKIGSNKRDYFNFGYKDMEESMGPVGCEAPPTILAAASPLREATPENVKEGSLLWATRYRDRSKAYNESQKKKAKTGDVVTFPEPVKFRDGSALTQFKVETRPTFSGRNQTVYRSLENGRLYKLPRAYISRAEVAA